MRLTNRPTELTDWLPRCVLHNPIHFQLTTFVCCIRFFLGSTKFGFNSMITFSLCVFLFLSSIYFIILIRHKHTFTNIQNDTFPLCQSELLKVFGLGTAAGSALPWFTALFFRKINGTNDWEKKQTNKTIYTTFRWQENKNKQIESQEVEGEGEGDEENNTNSQNGVEKVEKRRTWLQ